MEKRVFITRYIRWATITYWNYNKSNDKQFNCYENSILVYQNLTNNSLNKRYDNKQYFNLSHIQSNIKEEDENHKRLFNLIGNGIILTIDREEKKIRLDNRCDLNVYWTCPGLFYGSNQLDEKKFKSNKLKPNESNIIYDFKLIKLNENNISNNLIEFHVINISFGKCWGYNFKRKSLEYCPFWINVSVNLDYFK